MARPPLTERASMPYRAPMTSRVRTTLVALLTTLLVAGGTAVAGDEAKRDCRHGCEEAMANCKSDCRNERDSGTQQQTDRYAGCDSTCKDTYESCKSDCNGQ
jgi:hypothetical protein